jgi:hypothetical protein
MNFGSERARSAWPTTRAMAFLSSLSLLAACETTDPKPDGGLKVNGDIVIADVNNYKLTNTLTIPRVQTANQADLQICWDGLTKDLLCHAVNPVDDIGSVTFLQIKDLSEADVQKDLSTGKTFSTSVNHSGLYTVTSNGSTCASLSSFLEGKNPLVPTQDYVAGSNFVYMLLFAAGTNLGVNSKSMMFIEPTGTDTKVSAPSGCGIGVFKADLTTIAWVHAPKNGRHVADWSQVTSDGLGNKYLYSSIDTLQLGFYQGETTATLQDKFVDLDRIATRFYEMSLSGAASADLNGATSKTDGPFKGFDSTDGVWALALRCSGCSAPAPLIVAILEPTS